MSVERQEWIGAFLSLFQPIIINIIDREPESVVLDISHGLPDVYKEPGTLFVGHEISKAQTAYLSEIGAAFFDIRVSPIRFMAQDNIFAIGTNSSAIRTILAKSAMPPSDISVEAIALTLSLRYRDLGQGQFPAGSLVFFTEQPSGPDSIHHGDELSLDRFACQLEILAQRYPDRYMIARPHDPPADVTLLESMGFRSATANIYAALASQKVTSVAAIRSGIVSEARYFGKEVHVLDKPTTLLWNYSDNYDDGNPWFFNIAPNHALSVQFWQNVLSGKQSTQLDRIALDRPQDMIRRALNNWNSSALALNFRTQLWYETVGNHIIDLRHFLQLETGYRLAQGVDTVRASCPLLTGQWRWFNGEIVHIEADGHACSDCDFGSLTGGASEWAIHWVQRNLTDRLTIDKTEGRIFVQNQYGDGGEAVRLA